MGVKPINLFIEKGKFIFYLYLVVNYLFFRSLKYTYIVFSTSSFYQEYGFVKLPITELRSFETMFQ